ncbi:2-oxoacid:acceptor oxidoreductase subunit alpha [Hyphococcus luteus]|uniref:2-oxoglutarate ferredoxin oxidoreductase subunit alpha n=1 Tax=Hyphococcus luteus TaxID=2058213 RepID=A0A2S7K2K1_9PROT|nr:2-oxoacid:acceptor oxidoreductase subunit alpha [Marinicaulis flavus]PQA86726.1 2-oxoglutarate ferredoxin oxidoreductase subunit alpha [Marinicaulis flavus]
MAKISPENHSVVVRFAGDSGDGVQLLGAQFAESTALAGADFSTFPDFPAEIRAPVGTTFGVSAFQINLGARRISTAGDQPDVLVAFNPAALKVNLPLLPKGAVIIINTDAFTERNLAKAHMTADPRETGELDDFQVIEIGVSTQTQEAVKPHGLSKSDAEQCKNFWALGAILWMFGRDRDPIVKWAQNKFAKKPPEILAGNLAALDAGHAYAETAELSAEIPQFVIGEAPMEKGVYRSITGAEAISLGLAAAGELADKEIVFCGYPITPASSILHHLSRMGEYGVATFQAEDEIAAACAAIGASYGGKIGVTSSSGPGIALKTEAIGLAMATELPLVIVNSQRGGPSTGLPTKTEQSDLYQAVYGRNADAPMPVIAASSPGDCFDAAIEATRAAIRHMTPVFLLTDGYIANAAGPWALPDMDDYEPIKTNPAPAPVEGGDDPSLELKKAIWKRDEKSLGRPWVYPGMEGLAHRIGGLEKDIETGDISYDPANHQAMGEMRAKKVASVADFIPDQEVEQGPEKGPLAVVGWGSTHGAIWRAVNVANAEGLNVAQIHLRWLNPLPKNLADLLAGYDRILLPEMNMGQCATLLRDKLGLEVVQLNKVSGQPFKIVEILDAIRENIPGAKQAAE